MLVQGNVGIGTWLPTQKFYVNGNIYQNISGSNGYLDLREGGSLAIGSVSNAIKITPNAGPYSGPSVLSLSGDLFLSASGPRYSGGGNDGVNSGYFPIEMGNYSGDYISFQEYPSTELMRIDDNGNVGIGTTTPVGALSVMNGNVGIGTWVPTQQLQIIGTILADKQYNYPVGIGTFANNNGYLYVPKELLDSSGSPGANGKCLTSTGTQVAWVTCASTLTYNNPSPPNNSVQFDSGGFFGGSANFVFNGTNVGIGTIQSKNTLDVSNNVSIGTAYAGYKPAPANGLLIQGNMGIGSTVPGNTLDVLGTIDIKGVNGLSYPAVDSAQQSITIGAQAMLNFPASAAYDGLALGYQAMKGSASTTTTAIQNTAVGYQALSAITTGSNNTALAYQAATAVTTGSFNVALGKNMNSVNTGSSNTAIGVGVIGHGNPSNSVGSGY